MLDNVKTKDTDVIKDIGAFCKKFRVDYMNMSMTEFAYNRDLKIGNVNAFERGSANSIMYLLHYYNEADDSLKQFFINNIFENYNR